MEIVIKIAPISLALIMLALGMGLTIQDFTRVIKQPGDFIVGLICQLVFLPIIAFALVFILDVPVELAVGLMIIAAAPGGVTSNILTKFANGDVALSISLTAVISLLSILTVPFIIFKSIDLLNASANTNEISMIGISIKMFLVVTLPVILGMIIRRFANNFVSSNEKIIQTISLILFLIVLFGAIIQERSNIIPYLMKAGTITVLLNIIMMLIGFYVGKFFATGIKQRKCISLECGLQNGTLAIFVATQIFNDVTYIIPAAIYSLIMFATSLIFVFLIKKTN
jgi:BASS family bile acid:Na+ symporter